MIAAPEALEKVYGWKAIAEALESSLRAAQEWSRRNEDPLPIRRGHRGHYAFRSALADWMARQDISCQAHRKLRTFARSCVVERMSSRGA